MAYTSRVSSWLQLSHALLLLSKSDVHLLECYFVERAGHFQTFRLLILPQALPRGVVELSDLLPAVKSA